MLQENSLSHAKRLKTAKDDVSWANTDELCKNCIEEFQQLQGGLKTYKNGGYSKPSPDILKNALIEKVCILGARLCYVRDSQDLIQDAGLEISQALIEDINDIIYYRNQFRKIQPYKSVEERDTFFLSFLNLQSSKKGTIKLDDIIDFLNKLQKLKNVATLKNKLITKEQATAHETKETKEENDQPRVAQRAIDPIAALKVAKEYALNIEKSAPPTQPIETMAIRRHVMCMFQGYLDYKDSYGNSGNEKKRRKATNAGSKDQITAYDLVLLEGAHQSRKLMAHISDRAIKENEIGIFLTAHFSNYFETLLQNAIKFSQQNSATKTSSVSDVQANYFQDLEKELTGLKKSEEIINVKKTVDAPVEVQQLENFEPPKNSSPMVKKVEEVPSKLSPKNG